MEHSSLAPHLPLPMANDPVEKAFYHLLRHPYDLVDIRRLMLHLHASPQDIQQALILLEQETKDATEREP